MLKRRAWRSTYRGFGNRPGFWEHGCFRGAQHTRTVPVQGKTIPICLLAGNQILYRQRARYSRVDFHTCHILPPSEIDLGLCLAVFAGSGGKYLSHRIGRKGRIWQLWLLHRRAMQSMQSIAPAVSSSVTSVRMMAWLIVIVVFSGELYIYIYIY